MDTVVTTFIEPREPYLSEAARMFQSLRDNGGVLADLRCVCYALGPVPADFSNLGVEIVNGIRVHPSTPFANKIQCFQRREQIVYLDPDIVVRADFSHLLDGFRVGIAPAHPSRRLWLALHWLTGARLSPYYYNTGVVIAPERTGPVLAAEWLRRLDRLWHFPATILSNDLRRRHALEQFAFAMAAARQEPPVTVLARAEHWHTWWGEPPDDVVFLHMRRRGPHRRT